MTQGWTGTPMDQDVWSRYAPQVLSIVRIMVALLFFEHGLSKLFGFPQASPSPALFSLSWLAGAIERRRGTSRHRIVVKGVGIHHVGRDGVRLFHQSRTAGLLPNQQSRRCGDPVLLYLSLFRLCRGRAMEPRRAAGTAEFGAKPGKIGNSPIDQGDRPDEVFAGVT